MGALGRRHAVTAALAWAFTVVALASDWLAAARAWVQERRPDHG